ncbi:MAG: helix-turn-helix domain-containing protein [Deltaproteobacteria bacterium]|nr:helix-turn-helix domain-containing protein [Deltaproteobacteria bacterium]
MSKFEELTYYELLEIPPNASTFEIRQAYKEALSIYSSDSPISYSFFIEEERERILESIENAFATLIDAQKREQYDKRLVAEKKIDPSRVEKGKQKKPTPIFSTKSQAENTISDTIKKRIKKTELTQITEELLSKDLISGDDLKRLRKAVGIEVEEVFEVTRITVPILEAIERDDVPALPSSVYLKNFLRAYAELFHIDAEKVINSYLKNLDRIQGPS